MGESRADSIADTNRPGCIFQQTNAVASDQQRTGRARSPLSSTPESRSRWGAVKPLDLSVRGVVLFVRHGFFSPDLS